MHSLRRLVASVRSRPKAHLAVVFVAVANHMSTVALAATPAVLSATTPAAGLVCAPEVNCASHAEPATINPHLSLPTGTSRCGGGSGPAAACTTDGAAPSPGTPSTPVGLTPCAAVASKVLPSTPAACSGDALTGTPDAPAGAADVGDRPVFAPSVPWDSLGARLPDRLVLSPDHDAVRTGKPALLTATANASVTGTDRAIEIFDLTTGTLIGACAQGSECSVAYSASSGLHDLRAFVATPTSSVPDASVALPSNHVRVGWLDSGISANATIVGPGQPLTVTATSTFDVGDSGRWLEIYDLTAGARITYCSRGTSCATTIRMPTGGVHKVVGYVTGKPEAVSAPIYLTWLKVTLSATSVGPKTGGTVHLTATANADLSNTPWALGIYDSRGRLIDHACKTGTTCSVDTWMDGNTRPTYTAVIGSLPTPRPNLIERVSRAVGIASGQPLVDVQARSAAVEPTHLMWGVDSCKAFTGDPTGELFYAAAQKLGTPEFWGRYLTNTVCPGISSAEVALAAKYHMGILPIYNDYICGNVSYYETGHSYAVDATAAAQSIGIPKGRLIVVDIEPPGEACPGAANIDGGFIEGWFDGVKAAGYIPGYYGNGTNGSEFANAWCAIVSQRPSIATDSDLWTFQPSLLGSFSKTSAPGYSPYVPRCGGNMLAWQYVLSGGSAVDVDQDEALSSLPLWYPS